MARDILSEYGSDSTNSQSPRPSNGGQMPVKELPYSPPVGPSNINDSQTPGLHGSNHGNCGSQGKR